MIDLQAVRLVAGREIREQVRGRMLWISTLISVLAVAAIVVLPHVLAGGRPTYHVAVVGQPTAAEQQAIRDAVGSAGATAVLDPVGSLADAQARLQSRATPHAAFAVDLGAGHGSVLVDEELPSGSTSRKALAVDATSRRLAAERAAAASGLPATTVRALVAPDPLPVRHLRAAPGDNTDRGVAVAGAVLFYLLALRYGVGLLMGVVQEKSTRVIEVLLATVRPRDLLAGKVIGYSVLVFAQAVVLVATALVSAAAVGSTVLHAGAVHVVVEAAVWVIVGFLLYAVLFTAAGALASKPEDAQSAGAPLQIVLLVGYLASFTGLNGSPSMWLKVLAWVPFTAPMDMPVLAAGGGAGPWLVAASMLLTAAAIGLALWLGAAVFSRSILRSGQRVTLRRLWRERRA